VKINRLELIEKLKAMVAEREATAERRKAEAYTKAGEVETEYVQKHIGDWGKFADTIRLCNRRGQAITINDVPQGLRFGSGRYADVRLFQPVVVRESEFTARTEPLTRLIAVLESSPDEFISTSALDRIGAPLKELMRP
jgi:hypothetical protein